MKKFFLSLLAPAVSLLAVTLNPPLPEGAHCDWDLKNAWKRVSATETEYCINGLWQFRAAPELKPVEKHQYLFEYDVEDYDQSIWHFEDDKNISFQVSVDHNEHTKGNASLRIDVNAAPQTNLYQGHFNLKNIPCDLPCVLAFDVKTDAVGNEFQCEIQDARDWKYLTTRSSNISPKTDWTTVRTNLVIPTSTPAIKAIFPRCQIGNLKGSIWIDNIRIYRQSSAPAIKTAVPQDENWGCAFVPGSWMKNDGVFWHPKNKKNGPESICGWYRRTIDIPTDWTNKRLSVRFDRLATSATIYCNNQMAGLVQFNGGEVDITPFVTPGKKVELAVLVEARLPQAAIPVLSGAKALKVQNAGIYGDVFLRVRDAAPCEVARPRIVTTTADRTLSVQAALSAPAPAGATWKLDIIRNGKSAAVFQGDVPAGANAIDARPVWKDVVFWDVDNPALYELRLSLLQNGRLLSQTLPERFGFRDFVIRGRYFYLNGVKINLNPCSYAPNWDNWDTIPPMRHWLTKAQEMGYNYVYMEDNELPGMRMATKQFLELCDEMGMLAAISVPTVPNLTPESLDGKVAESWRAVAKRLVDVNFNHPSLVLWRMNMNLSCPAQDQNPLSLDGKFRYVKGSAGKSKEERALWSNAFIRSLDPTRSTYNHACGYIGEMYTSNNYLGWPEQQDLREWLRVWAQGGNQPLMMVEHAIPYPGDLQMRDPDGWWSNEPLQSEYAAILLGERSYELEEPRYVDYLQSAWNPKRRGWNSSYGYFCQTNPMVLDECTVITYSNMYQYWRTWGISGGMNVWENNTHRPLKFRKDGIMPLDPPPAYCKIDWSKTQHPGRLASFWSRSNRSDGQIHSLFGLDLPHDDEWFEPAKHYFAFRRLMSRIYAYFGGPKERWYTVEHAFRSGEKVEKTLIVLNDKRKPVTFTAEISLVAGKQTTKLATQKITVQPAEVGFIPFSFTVPDVKTTTDVTLQAKVTADKDAIQVKPLALQLHPAAKPIAFPTQGWALLDPAGKTRDAFARIGWKLPVIAQDTPLPANTRVLVIGANALDTAAGCTALQDAAKLLPKGLRVLVCEHSDATLARVFGLRAFTPGSRQSWLRDPKHPALSGMRNVDFTDWRGATTFGPLDGLPESPEVRQREKRVWRCSQEGIVASAIIEKPHVNVVHPLLDTGFALRYTALWEVPCDLGTILFCNLDVTDRLGREPAADGLLGNLVNYLDRSPATASSPVVGYLGAAMTDPDTSVYQQGLVSKSSDIQILGRGCLSWLKQQQNQNALANFARNGGTIVVLGLDTQEALMLQNALGGFSTKNAVNWLNPLEGTLPDAFRGISVADIRWRIKLDTPVIAKTTAGWRSPTGVLAEIPVNKGRLVWLSGIPQDFDPKVRKDLVFTRVLTTRLLNVVLQNLKAYRSATPNYWAQRLAATDQASETNLYTDKRTVRDDPYAEMRW